MHNETASHDVSDEKDSQGDSIHVTSDDKDFSGDDDDDESAYET